MCNAHYNLNITPKSPRNHKILCLKFCMAFNCVHKSVVVVIVIIVIFAIICVVGGIVNTRRRFFSSFLGPKSIFFAKLHNKFFTLFSLLYACETANCSLLWIIYTLCLGLYTAFVHEYITHIQQWDEKKEEKKLT